MKTADEIRAEEIAAEEEDYSPEEDARLAAVIAHAKATIAENTYKTTVTVELAHREALEAEAIKRGIDAKLAANGYTPNGEAIEQA